MFPPTKTGLIRFIWFIGRCIICYGFLVWLHRLIEGLTRLFKAYKGCSKKARLPSSSQEIEVKIFKPGRKSQRLALHDVRARGSGRVAESTCSLEQPYNRMLPLLDVHVAQLGRQLDMIVLQLGTEANKLAAHQIFED